jgi:hypothetical protein
MSSIKALKFMEAASEILLAAKKFVKKLIVLTLCVGAEMTVARFSVVG